MDIETLTGGVNNWGVDREYVSPEIKAKYEELMNQIKMILNKTSYTEEDSQALEAALKDLKKLQDQGLETGMSSDLELLFLFLKSAGAKPEKGKFYLDPTALEALRSIQLDMGNGRYLTIDDALALALDPERRSDATQKLGDMLLDFSRWSYDIYAEKLKDLQKQVELATKAINQLKAILDILNKTKVIMPDDFKFTPDNLNQIPEEIKKKLRAMGVNDDKMIEWIKNKDNLNTYIDLCEAYFKEELGYEPDITRDDVLKLLSTRDELQKILDDMKNQGADTSEGSPYDTIQKVIADIDKQFPPDKFPPGKDYEADMDQVFKPSDRFNNQIFEYWLKQNPDGSYSYYRRSWVISEEDGKTWLYEDTPVSEGTFNEATRGGIDRYLNDLLLIPGKEYVNSGQGQSSVKDNIDKALQSNENLSSKMSDEMKAQNTLLNTIFDILSQVLKAYDKINQSFAQKIGR
jgi:hypothetical protein